MEKKMLSEKLRLLGFMKLVPKPVWSVRIPGDSSLETGTGSKWAGSNET